jgi:SAM-dependent methyltransferase
MMAAVRPRLSRLRARLRVLAEVIRTPPPPSSLEVSSFHYSDVRPEILARRRPVVLEIGVFQGSHTRLLLNACLYRFGTVICIDPAPTPEIERFLRVHPCGKLIRATSLEALSSLAAEHAQADVAIIDGDHNYYTVCCELQIIGSVLKPDGVIFLHDVGWPYARRDMYYEPSRIPPEHRHAFRRAGIVKGQSDLETDAGMNSDLYNAEHEGGPRNGVLTAVEDFVSAGPERWTLTVKDIGFGLAILRRKPEGSA